jgi:hypothetical protein
MDTFFWCYLGAVTLLVVFFIVVCLWGVPRRERKGIDTDDYDWDGLHHIGGADEKTER